MKMDLFLPINGKRATNAFDTHILSLRSFND
jgi:hypothetical protein